MRQSCSEGEHECDVIEDECVCMIVCVDKEMCIVSEVSEREKDELPLCTQKKTDNVNRRNEQIGCAGQHSH